MVRERPVTPARVVVVSPVTDAVAGRASSEFAAVLSQDRNMTAEEMLTHARNNPVEAVFLTSRIRLDAKTVAALPDRIRIVATCSVGYDHIDLSACEARGLIVTNTPDVLTDATADLTFMLMLCACRRASEYHGIMKAGWRELFGLNHMLGMQVSGKTLGIIGMGRIGRAVAQRARGFGMKVLYHDMYRLPPGLEQGAMFHSELHEMLPQCHIVTLHAPGGKGLILGRETIALLPRGAVVINAARGDLVDEDALIDALKSGHLFSAGLDVYKSEPDYDLRLRDLPNVFMTPHMGSATVETRNAMGFRALDNIAAVLSGGQPIDPVRNAD
jgi:lactate dehydrogenase-like 2-hydroxyacid dehydrogenase